MQFILYKDNASERNVSLLTNCRVQLILYKDNAEYFLQSYLKSTGITTFLLKNPPLTILFFLRPLPLVLNILYSQLFFYLFRHMY